MPTLDTPPGFQETKSGSGLLVPTDFAAAEVSDFRTPSVWLTDVLRGARTLAGTQVSPDSALTLSAYYACIYAISSDVAKVPFLTYEQQGRAKIRNDDHVVFPLLNIQSNPFMGAMTFREVMMSHVLGWGNAYAEIVWDQNTRKPKALYPIHPSRVRITNLQDQGVVYDIRSNYSQWMGGIRPFEYLRLPAKDVLHLRGLGTEGLYGYSIAQMAAESLGLTMAGETFAAAFFGNGATLGGILTHPATLSDAAMKRIRESWEQRYQGPYNASKVAILEENMQYTKVGIPPNEAQFIEGRSFQIHEIARWFRMPVHKIQQYVQSMRTTIEQQALEYVTDCLTPWYTRFEQEVRIKLFVDEPTYFAKHLLMGLTRGDHAARATYYESMLRSGVFSPNDVREMEDLNPIGPEGDIYFIQGNNLVPLKSFLGPGGEVRAPLPAVPPPQPPGGLPRRPVPTNGAVHPERNGHIAVIEDDEEEEGDG